MLRTTVRKEQGSVMPNKEHKSEKGSGLNIWDVLDLRELWGIGKRNE